MFRTTPDYLQQAIGYFGWIDAPLPLWTYWLFIAAFALLVVLGFIATRTSQRADARVGGRRGALVPAFVQAYSVHQTGIIWQGRYGLFLYLGITMVAAWLLSRDAPTLDYPGPACLVGAVRWSRSSACSRSSS